MSYDFNAAEVYRIAIQIEENGRTFYEEGQKLVQDTGVRELFGELALQEIEHKKKFEALVSLLPPETAASTVWDPENELDQYIRMMADEHVFVTSASVKEEIARLTDARSALKLAMELEKDSVIFFLGLEDATRGKKDQELIHALVKEEQEHLRRLTAELVKLARK